MAGNWKMNGLSADLAELSLLRHGLGAGIACEILVCPPASLIARAASVVEGAFALGGQDCHRESCGAFTGDISAEMLKDAGASYVIVGHSERRQYHGETDDVVAAKAQAAWRAGLAAIICVGETEVERDRGHAKPICHGQIKGSVPKTANAANTAIAYEPVWAIGTGKTPSDDDIAAMHAHLRECLVAHLGEAGRDMRILYGGSVKPSNATAILSLDDVNGALVGGASLKARDFLAIIGAARTY
ncbi:MAG TPA: triose-phosphate isomerase [Rhizomicrobium sp.]